MSSGLVSSSAHALGPAFAPQRIRAYNRTTGTLTRGQTGILDILAFDAATTSFLQGEQDSVWANIITLAPSEVLHAFTVVQESDSVADDNLGTYFLWGTNIDAEVQVTSDSGALQGVSLDDATNTLQSPSQEASGAITRKVVGVIKDPAGVAVAIENLLYFDGFYGVR